MTFVACSAALMLVATTVQAGSITVYNSGVDDGGVVLAEDAIDTHWTVSGVGPAEGWGPEVFVATGAGGFPIGPWLGDSSTSAWISPALDTGGPGATDGSAIYTFSTTFTTPGDGQVSISGNQSADNSVVAVDVDGISGTFDVVGFNMFGAFSVDAAVTGTTHTLNFSVHNGTGEATPDGPIGFRVEFESAEYVPEPTSFALLAMSGLALFWPRQ